MQITICMNASRFLILPFFHFILNLNIEWHTILHLINATSKQRPNLREPISTLETTYKMDEGNTKVRKV